MRSSLNNLFRKLGTPRSDQEFMEGGRGEGENESPYLSARRTWNDYLRSVETSRAMWQLLAILSLMICLASVGGIIYIGSQSKFVPYIVQVDKLGEAVAVARADVATVADERVIHASVASFINDLRMVTPDTALQRKAIYRTYAMLSNHDPAFTKTNDWLNGTEASSPFKRASTETVSIEIISVIPQSQETWQVDWQETIYDRTRGTTKEVFQMRALLRIYVATHYNATEDQIRRNPLGIYIADYSWSRKT